MGSVGGALWPAVGVAATVIFPASLVLMHNAQKLNILLLGEEEATHLGVETDKLKRLIIVCTALSVGVAVSGLIGFVGLVVPQQIWQKVKISAFAPAYTTSPSPVGIAIR